MGEAIYGTRDAAEFIGVSRTTIYAYMDKGLLVPDFRLPSSGVKKGICRFTEKTLVDFKASLTYNKEEGE